MSDQLDKHIGALTLGSDQLEEKPNGLFDDGDKIIEGELTPTPIPPGVEDEQAKVFKKQDQKSDPPDEGTKDYKALYEAEQKSSSGLLGEVGKLRTKLSGTNESIESLRRVFLERENAEAARVANEQAAFELEEERRMYGDEVVDDPAVSYMRDKWVQTQDMLAAQDADRAAQQAAFNQRAAEISAANAEFAAVKAAVVSQEEAFVKEHPDYYDAYKFARQSRVEFYQDMGWDPGQAITMVNQEEEGIRQQQLSRPDGSVPEAVYAVAKRFGWDPGKAAAEAEKRPTADYNQGSPNFDKMRAGVGSRGSGELNGRPGTGQDKRMSAQEFYDTVPIAKRIEIQSDPDRFEELGRTGFITVDW